MISLIYEKQRKRRKQLIRKLFVEIAKDSFRNKLDIFVKLKISEEGEGNFCGYRYNCQYNKYILIAINLALVNERCKMGFSASYYEDRPDFLNKYIINNKHNTLRFILYHEARHAYQRLNNIRDSMSKETAERDADEWAIKHLKGAK